VPGSGGELVRTLEGGAKPLVGLAFSPDGARIAAGSWHFCVFVWDVAGGAPVELAMPDEGVYNAVDGVSWSADGALVAGSSKDETARVWRISDGALAASLRGHTDAVSKLAFAPSGTTLVTASNDGTLRLWNAEDGTELARLNGHADDVVDVSFAPDGRRIASASSDGTVRVWDVEDPGVFGGLRMRNPAATYVARFSPDDRMLATCSYDGRAQLWCAGTGDLLASWQAHPGDKSCHMLDWTPDGRALATGSYDGTARLWDVATLEELARFDHDGELYWLRSSPDGRRLATCSGKTVVVHDLESGARLHAFEGHSSSVLAVAFSPDSRTCVSTGRDGKALVWDADTGELGYVVERGTDVAEALFTPSGDELVVADRSGRVGLYRASDGGPIRELVRNRHGMDHVDLSPDGARLALASEAVTLVDVEHGGILARFRPHRERPYAVDFDSKGERLASVSTDGTIAILDVRPLRERLVLARDVRARREREGARLRARLDAGAELADLAAEIRDDSTLTAEERSVRIAALLRLAAAHRP
jgi:WD40 repeat protein